MVGVLQRTSDETRGYPDVRPPKRHQAGTNGHLSRQDEYREEVFLRVITRGSTGGLQINIIENGTDRNKKQAECDD